MKKNLLAIIILFFTKNSFADITINSQHTKTIPIIIATLEPDNIDLKNTAKTIADNLEFTGQFEAQQIILDELKSKNAITKLHEKADLLLTLNSSENGHEWRLYRTKTADMITGKTVQKLTQKSSDVGHTITDMLLPVLTQKESSFSGKLAYCKHDPKEKNKTQICVADSTGKNETVIADLNTVAIAPRWAGTSSNPSLLYSQYTSINMQLVANNLQGTVRVATDFDGLNMLPTFSESGNYAIVCLSVEGSSQLYRYQYNKRKKQAEYIRLTENTGNNLSPSLLPDERIVFCSDFETKRPQIYVMNKDGKEIKKLSDEGCCTSPTYCKAKNSIAYSKLVNGVSQIMVYNFDTKETKQLTSDLWHKEEPSWSPCGNYLAYSVADKTTKRIAVHNCLTNKRKVITKADAHYSFPTWSGHNLQLPVKS